MNNTPIYNIAVLGANGGIGRQVTELALKEGHHVTAILRNPANLNLTHPHLTVVKGDIFKPETFQKQLEGKDAVISAIGSTSFKQTVLYSQGNRQLLAAMKAADVSRVFFVSASGLEINPTHGLIVRLAARFILQKLLKNMYADLERMEALVKQNAANWTILRPPRLTNNPVTGRYRFAIDHFLENGLSISRADLAHFILHNIKNTEIYRTTVEVAY